MKNKLLIFLFLTAFLTGFAQKNLTWEDLSDVKFTEKYNEKFKADFLFPEFGPSVKALEGKEISIIGYFLNIDFSLGNCFQTKKKSQFVSQIYDLVEQKSKQVCGGIIFHH